MSFPGALAEMALGDQLGRAHGCPSPSLTLLWRREGALVAACPLLMLTDDLYHGGPWSWGLQELLCGLSGTVQALGQAFLLEVCLLSSGVDPLL